MTIGLSSRLLLEDLTLGGRLLWSLPAFLRRPITLSEARATVATRLASQEATFLAISRNEIYGNPASPYLGLLKLAGCEYGDLEQLVRREGVEGALYALLHQGVYLTVDEFKGRRPAIRGSASVAVDPVRLRSRASAVHVLSQSGGSRGSSTSVPLDLGFIRDNSIHWLLSVEAAGGTAWDYSIWVVPGGSALSFLLKDCATGRRPVRWFSQVDPAAPSLHPRYRWSHRLVVWASRLSGVSLPHPEYVSLEDPLPVASWMARVLGRGRTPFLLTFPSSAVRVCEAALNAGLSLAGAQFSVGGEPLTDVRVAVISRAGARALPGYATQETGYIAKACVAPQAADDMHVFQDSCALIQPGPEVHNAALPARALLVTSLRPRSPFILLNVSMGDQGEVASRVCGCPMERLGWTTHLHSIRSFEKLTAGGMTFLDSDVVRVLEDALPARFGGGITDYQLTEEEDQNGRTRLVLLVYPSVGPLDLEAVKEVFLREIGRGSGGEHVMELQWRTADVLRVERRIPMATESGKIQHLHLERSQLARSAV